MNLSDIDKKDYDRHWDMLWNVQLGIRYHMHMQNFYGRFGKIVTAFTLILSTSAGVTLIGSNLDIAKILAFTAALLQILELVIDSKTKTILHTTLRQRYIQLESELANSDYLTKSENAALKAKRSCIEIEEPPIISSLMNVCNNELVKVYDLDDSYKQDLSLMNKLKAWWFS